MPDNTYEEHLDGQEINQSENPADEISLTVDTEAISITEETQNMEVHHHAHHGHGTKNWKNYFWEFFMLFLAVFCGFLAEIQVEHYVEHQREKKYMQMYIEDLRTDSARFYRTISLNKARLVKLDELITQLNRNDFSDSSTLLLYNLNSKALGFSNFLFNTRTLSQLKTAGGYKLIREKAIADSLINRDIDVEWNDGMRERLNDSWVRAREAGANIFEEYQVYAYLKSTADNPNSALDSALNAINPLQKKQNHHFSLLTNDRKEIATFSTSVIYFQKLLNRYIIDLISYQRKCNSLIYSIKEKYHVE
jgi:hypothetical protein